MSIKTYYHIGIFLELNVFGDKYKEENQCQNRKCTRHNKKYDVEIKYCPYCSIETTLTNKKIGSESMNIYEVADELEIDSELFRNCGEVSSSNQKFFSYEASIEGVPDFELDGEHFMNLNIDSEKTISEAMKDNVFYSTVEKLKNKYGDSFKIHYGLYTRNW
jgi:hypothetical protein